MIKCEVCKKYKPENSFPLVRGGGFAICSECLNIEEGKNWIAKMEKLIAGVNLKTQEEMEREYQEQIGKYERW